MFIRLVCSDFGRQEVGRIKHVSQVQEQFLCFDFVKFGFHVLPVVYLALLPSWFRKNLVIATLNLYVCRFLCTLTDSETIPTIATVKLGSVSKLAVFSSFTPEICFQSGSWATRLQLMTGKSGALEMVGDRELKTFLKVLTKVILPKDGKPRELLRV